MAGSFNTGALTATTTYTITCTGAGGSSSQSIIITVASAPPTVSVSATSTSIANGASTTITWTSTNSTSCTSSPAIEGFAGASGTINTPPLTTTTIYTVTCTGAGGSASQDITITVAPSNVSSVISGFTGAGVGSVTVTSANTLTNGTAITISGTTSYDGTYTVANVTAASFTITATFVANEATGVWQLAGGMISGCPTTGDTSAITLSNDPSRFNGVAPLAVFFDATTATATTRPFHDLEYRWDFDDPDSGTWASGAQPGVSSKNSATGPVAAHVFETPGIYTVALTATDGTNTVSNSCAQIVVYEPDAVFAGNNTVCIAASTLPVQNEGGCPAGASTAQQPSFPSAISSYAKTGKRVLFKRGDTFTAATPGILSSTGPGSIGAFGTGALPIVQATGGSTILQLSSPSTPTVSDWRMMDLDLDGMSGAASMGVRSYGTITQATLLRLAIHDIQYGVQLDASTLDYFNSNNNPGHVMWDQFALVDSTILHVVTDTTGYGGYGFFGAGNRLAVLGSTINDSTVATHGHISRFTYLTKSVISNNTLSNQGPVNTLIKMHGPTWVNSTTPPTGIGASGYTEKVVVSDNKLMGTGTWSVNLGPQNGDSDERLRNILVERNWFTASSGVAAELVINAVDVTVRNNLFDMSNATLGERAMTVDLRTPPSSIEPPPLRVSILNNTFYSSNTTGLTGVYLGAAATNTTVINNLGYAPTAGGAVLLNDAGSTGLVVSNNSSNAQVRSTSPNFTTTPPATPADFKVTAGYAIGGGLVVPVWSDFFLVPQTTSRDIGAVIH